MKPKPWNRRLLESTRGRIISLLRRSEHTVNELAQALGLTDNAIRGHIASLERDGLVRPKGTRRGAHKPTVTYALTPEAEHLFPRPYGPLLRTLLDLLAERLPAEAVDDIARTAGRRLAAYYRTTPPGSRPRERAAQVQAVLSEFGGMPEVEEQDGRLVVRCVPCPLAAVVAGHPAVCRLVEALLSDVAGIPVREQCRRGEAPECHFEVGVARGA